MLALIELH